MKVVPEKYKPAELPSKAHALTMAATYDEWAAVARENDRMGSAQQFEMMALLLRYYAGDSREPS